MPSLAAALKGGNRVWLLTAVLAAGTVALSALIQHAPALYNAAGVEWWAVAMGFGLVEIFVVHLHFRRDAHSFSLSEMPLTIGLFFITPVELIAAQVVGAAVALWLHRKQPLMKLTLNLANLAFSAAVAVVLFRVILGGRDPLALAGWLGTYAAAVAADVLSLVFIVAAITLSLGRPPDIRRLFATGVVAAFFNTSLALLAVTVIWKYPAASWLLFVLAAVLVLGYRAYGSLRQKHESLELLYTSTKAVQQSLDVEPVTEALLAQARSMFRADLAEILLFSTDGDPGSLVTLGPEDERPVVQRVQLDPTEGVWARVASEGRALLLPRPITNERLSRYFGERGIRDAMVAPLHGGDEVIGTLLVGNRRTPLNTFSPEDLQVFETLANHASVSLQNGRLVDRLRRQAEENEHQALHDALTGLANRSLFRRRLEAAIDEQERAGGWAAVMIIDLDRFKEVNDTLGHHNGDTLLREIAARLVETLGSEATIARLGGDEFAILLPSVGDRERAIRSAQVLLESIERPFAVRDLQLHVGASIGIALCPEHATDPDTLIQRADVAMYLAKEAHTGYEVYTPERDQYSPGRLALAGELRRAIEGQELVLFYQPKASLATGRIIGAEALVRWQHPRRGFIAPDEFIPIAEHTGLIQPMTLYLLEAAIRQCGDWRASGFEVAVAVNLSVRSLLQPSLADDIARMLLTHRVSASALELEITESTIIADPAATEAVLNRLASLGIEIAIDDFGTGYSSLAYLKRLPVDELKIDKSFVLGMASDENDAVIVRSMVELGRSLGLRVVAEGVETRQLWDQLRALGCDVAQGFYLGRPMTAEQLTKQLAESRHAARRRTRVGAAGARDGEEASLRLVKPA
ncbi:MAG: EAL domain-containing protein [Chloroflexota bacterium]|nr:EAL domain-containing protein [Chloroflexota bacterium]